MLSQSRVIAKGERIRDVQRPVAEYDGRASQWVKKSSAQFEVAGERFEYHWYEHPGGWQVRSKAGAGELTMVVKLKKRNARNRDLTFGQRYVVIGIEADHFRILNNAGSPFLYPPGLFRLVDAREPGEVA